MECPNCDGTGRHTFTVEVGEHERPPTLAMERAGEALCDGCTRTYRVSVVPGMVLPIMDYEQWRLAGASLPAITKVMLRYMLRRANGTCDWITLPPAAAPGMWAVKLEVHT
jgi:hypothetical protein